MTAYGRPEVAPCLEGSGPDDTEREESRLYDTTAGSYRRGPQQPSLCPGREGPCLVFVAGQGPYDPASGAIVGTTIQEQTRQCLTNIQVILEAAGSSLDKIVSMTFILGDPADFTGMNEEWRRWFPTDPPARQGAKLPLDVPGLRLSVAAIAEV